MSAKIVRDTKRDTLLGHIHSPARPGTKMNCDEARAYDGLLNHESVRRGVGEYVRGQAHTNGIESFWTMMKRGYNGTYHKLSPKHLDRYVDEFCGRHNMRWQDTADQMAEVARRMPASGSATPTS